MKETTPAAIPPCFERWCQRFDDIWRHQAQKREFKNYIGEAFRTAISYRFFEWLQQNRDVFFAFKQALGLIWA